MNKLKVFLVLCVAFVLLDGIFIVRATWGPWDEWSSCSASCGMGTVERKRYCIESDGSHRGFEDCTGDSVDTKRTRCGPDIVQGHWTPWNGHECHWCMNDIQYGRVCTTSWTLKSPCVDCGEGNTTKPCEDFWCGGLDCPYRQRFRWTEWSEWDATCGYHAIRIKDLECHYWDGIPETDAYCGSSYEGCDEWMWDNIMEQDRYDLPPCKDHE